MTRAEVKFLNSIADMPKTDPAQWKDVPNDTGMSIEAANAILAADGVEIPYGDISLVVQRCDFEEAKKEVAKVPAEDRQPLMQLIDDDLSKNLKIMKAGKAIKEIYDEFYQDLMLWTALQEYAAEARRRERMAMTEEIATDNFAVVMRKLESDPGRNANDNLMLTTFKGLYQFADKETQLHLTTILESVYTYAMAGKKVCYKHDADTRTFSIGLHHGDDNNVEVVAEIRFRDKGVMVGFRQKAYEEFLTKQKA